MIAPGRNDAASRCRDFAAPERPAFPPPLPFRVPRVPALPGLGSYTGVFTHSVNYRNASSYVGKRVLVVGLGNSGAEIATQLVEKGASLVAMSIRTPPPIVPRDPFGSPVQRTSILLSQIGGHIRAAGSR
jgi:cation diffusion facilitator CzcD-associated flavoprotein CzcO